MNEKVSTFPDQMLRLTQALPWPLSSATFNVLRMMFETRGRANRAYTRIRFGQVAIDAPLDHPAVYWRYRPVGFNRNFLSVVRHVVAAREGLVIDVGANIGDGVALLRGEGVNAPVLAIEGAGVWFDLLKQNTKSLSSVWLENVFLGTGEAEQPVALYVHDGTSQLVKSERGVDITTLDQVMQRHSEHPVALLKTDTDGFDLKVLKGARKLLSLQQPVVFAEVDEGLMSEQGDKAEDLVRYFLDCGYLWVAIWDNLGRWMGHRELKRGISDLVARCPGGPKMPYLDVALFAERDRKAYESISGSYEKPV